ncbi:MAG: YceI family protein [Trueperaceae bacterium]
MRNIFMLCLAMFLFIAFVQAQHMVTLAPKSFVEYEAKDQTASWIGRAPVARFEFTLDTEELGNSSLTIAVNTEDFFSGNFIRDTNARRTVFESDEFPEIVFASGHVSSEIDTLADGESRDVDLTGSLTMHGVTQDVQLIATLSRQSDTITAIGSFDVTYTDFGMRQPELFGTVVEDVVVIRFNVVGQIQ